MKRLPAQIGITYFSVLAAAFYLPDAAVKLLCAAALIAAVLFFSVRKIRKRIWLPLAALAVCAACAVHVGYTALTVEPLITEHAGKVSQVEAVLTDEPYQSYAKYYYRLKTLTVGGEKVGTKLLLKSPVALNAEPDDVLTFTAELEETDSNYYRAKGYLLTVDEYDLAVAVAPPDKHSLYYHAIQLRRRLREALDHALPDGSASLCRAILIGDKYAMDQDMRDRFRYAGASYFIVVSGMHFAVLCMLMLKLMKPLNRILRLVLMIGFMLLYAAVTGFQPSVVRSGIMMAITVIGLTVRRQVYPLNHLGIAGLILPFIVSPEGAGDIGLLLSYYATLSVLLWAEPITDKLSVKNRFGQIEHIDITGSLRRLAIRTAARWKHEEPDEPPLMREPLSFRVALYRIWNSIAAVLAVSLAANILVFPISVFLLREFSLVTLLSAVLLYPEIYWILILALFVAVFYWLGPLRYAAILLAYPLDWLCRLVRWIVTGLGSLPWVYIRVTQRFFLLWLAFAVLLGAVVLMYRDRKRYIPFAALSAALILIGGAAAHFAIASQALTLEVYSCGNGLCAAVNDGGDWHLLSMNANTEYLYPLWRELFSRSAGASTALCCDKDQLRGYQLYDEDEFAISAFLLYDREDEAPQSGNILRFGGDSEFRLDNDLTLRVCVVKDKAAPYLTADDKRILIVPKGCTIDDIPPDCREADIIVLQDAFSGAEQLRCERLIISAEAPKAKAAAYALRGIYQQVSFSDEGDIALDLR